MNGSVADGVALASGLADKMRAHSAPAFDMLVCPPATLLLKVAEALSGSGISLGGQDCHAKEHGAHTGDISAKMLADVGCQFVIVGHSERRADHGETDAVVRSKAEAALAAGLTPVICVGETEAERDAGRALEVVGSQLKGSLPDGAGDKIVVAYEPVWAIGTGRTPTPDDAQEVHAAIRADLHGLTGAVEQIRVLYGGSVKPDNAASLLSLPDIDGALVGGASLKVADFWGIAESCG